MLSKLYIKKIKINIERLINTGFFHIFGSSTINKIIGFMSSIFIVRIISKSEFGVYSYANNIFSFIMIVTGMGMIPAVYQLCSEKSNNQAQSDEIYKYGFYYGMRFNILLCILTLSATFFVTLPVSGSGRLLSLMSFYFLPNLVIELQKIRLRVTFQNKKYSFLNNIDTIFIFVCSITGALLFQTEGLIYGRYIASVIIIIIAVYFFKCPIVIKKTSINKENKNTLYKFATISVLNDGLAQVLMLNATFIIGLLIKDENAIATYKAATIIPTALLFIPSALIVYAYPYFAAHKNDLAWTKKMYKYITLAMTVFNLLILIFFVLFAPVIISVIYGKEYLDAVQPFKILICAYFFQSSFRMIAGNLLVTQRKLYFNMFINILTAVISVLLNIFLIPILNSEGAALSNLICMVLTSICSTLFYVRIINGKDNNKGIFKSLGGK